MKKIKFFLMAMICLVVSNVAKADDRPISVEQLPEAAKSFIQTNFEGLKIVYAEKDWNTYECMLENGTKVEFDRKGVWKKVDCEGMIPFPLLLFLLPSSSMLTVVSLVAA